MKLTKDHTRVRAAALITFAEVDAAADRNASDIHELEGENPELQYFSDFMALAEGIGKLVGLDVEVLGDKKYSIPQGQWEDFLDVYWDVEIREEARKFLNKLYGVSGNEDLLSPYEH